MANLSPLLRLIDDIARTGVRKVVPASAEKIRGNISSNANDIMTAAMGDGFSFNPRTGEMLVPKSDMGFMMATRPEVAGLNRQPASMQALDYFVNDPVNLEMMRRGGYLGGWVDSSTGQLVLDVPNRFLSKSNAIVRGADANQMAMFDMLRQQEIPLTPENIARAQEIVARMNALKLMAASGVVGAGIGGAGQLALGD